MFIEGAEVDGDAVSSIMVPARFSVKYGAVLITGAGVLGEVFASRVGGLFCAAVFCAAVKAAAFIVAINSPYLSATIASNKKSMRAADRGNSYEK